MELTERIHDFLAGKTYAVVGASTDRSKYGNKVLRCYQQHGRTVYAVNPKAPEIEGAPCVRDLASLPEVVHGISIVTSPTVTESVVDEAHRCGITRLWMQPGAESPRAIQRCRELGIELIAGGPCLLVVMGYRERE